MILKTNNILALLESLQNFGVYIRYLMLLNKSGWGGARAFDWFPTSWACFFLTELSSFSIVARSSIHAIIFTLPPQCSQTDISMSNTLFSRWAQVILARLSPSFWALSLASSLSGAFSAVLGMIKRLYGLFGANTPWNRVKFTRGVGTNAAKRATKSNASNITWVVPSLYALFSSYRTFLFVVSDNLWVDTSGLVM